MRPQHPFTQEVAIAAGCARQMQTDRRIASPESGPVADAAGDQLAQLRDRQSANGIPLVDHHRQTVDGDDEFLLRRSEIPQLPGGLALGCVRRARHHRDLGVSLNQIAESRRRAALADLDDQRHAIAGRADLGLLRGNRLAANSGIADVVQPGFDHRRNQRIAQRIGAMDAQPLGGAVILRGRRQAGRQQQAHRQCDARQTVQHRSSPVKRGRVTAPRYRAMTMGDGGCGVSARRVRPDAPDR